MIVHPTAQVDPAARLGRHVSVGPFCIVGPDAVLEDGVELKSHVVVAGDTVIGAGTVVFPFAVLGEIPQDLKYAGERTRLRIGPRNRIREHVTMNIGTAGGGETRVGEGCLFMAGCHVAHDAQVGDRVVVANNAAIAGHCVIGDDVVIGGLAGIHQWVRVGRGAMIGALSMVTHDVIPHGLVQGPRGELEGLNLVGLKRRGHGREEIAALRTAYGRLREGEGAFLDRARALAGDDSPLVREVADFVLAGSDRHFLAPR
ncbi:acyl-ACP--UDP-N-acetylglucosamine O-acyltransferase [Rubellimicrobium sp. CFH 75288]|uniref:acyl-ACP--UDP-N-acetylglucosamine O-acyltransferase n=1 Tax=Rubellimicrobium sp. CFH 75288 TaxID=2697034 RepID=UPI0014130679|nr:acyl-ACP--UDP-N-acetylglucosamine O-acyltransferase [Rubellimicrobium sp. CFH 75288]NAZ36965.1 acyl-ACP--UDP-N-acetylglucosamine O-acyltransferase [Rubellimicrobium sp. CFH 75288]